MHRHLLDRTGGGDERLSDHLSAKDALPARLRREAAKEIYFQRLEVEDFQERFNGLGHWRFSAVGETI
jgi:hypothetical protein